MSEVLYKLKYARKRDIYPIIDLIKHRIDWMDEVGIDQWNKSGYLAKYTYSYFEDLVDDKLLYVLKDEANVIWGAMTLLELDARWPGYSDALFVHNLVTKKELKNGGKMLLNYALNEAVTKHKSYIRLDAIVGNDKLNSYYHDLGFEYIDTVVDGNYKGNLLAKKVIK
ncbi:hypothetical protein [Mycoplasma sp. P36-A1]|uniref:hypothetical protein n=1 Tax=Mycoplasma sp. P36-A1 TaxID=3252900 RepID=UPI003C2BFB28